MAAGGCGGGSGRRRGRGRGARPPAQCPVDGTRSPRYGASAAAQGLCRGERPSQHLLFTQAGAFASSLPIQARGARGAPEPPAEAAAAGVARPAGCGARFAGLMGERGAGERPGGAPAGPGAPTRLSLQCKSRRDKLLINSREEAAVSFFLLFLPCFHSGMAPSYARGSLTAQQFSLHFNILKKMQITALWPF